MFSIIVLINHFLAWAICCWNSSLFHEQIER